jgi:hypothetical protein
MGRRKAEFLGFKHEIINGQQVAVKVFRSVTEPTIDLQDMLDKVGGASPTDVRNMNRQVWEYKRDYARFLEAEIEEEIEDNIEYYSAMPSTIIKKDHNNFTTEDTFITEVGGRPLDVDEFLEVNT